MPQTAFQEKSDPKNKLTIVSDFNETLDKGGSDDDMGWNTPALKALYILKQQGHNVHIVSEHHEGQDTFNALYPLIMPEYGNAPTIEDRGEIVKQYRGQTIDIVLDDKLPEKSGSGISKDMYTHHLDLNDGKGKAFIQYVLDHHETKNFDPMNFFKDSSSLGHKHQPPPP